ncbi:MAG: divalent-cation tolerance protein CutA [Proteobacteria bacterium]|nr:divalent-cation tolerance protein CutA [Pseudomonadota bacterium]
MKKSQIALYYVTCPSSKVAESLAKETLNKKLSACANIIPNMKSLYFWKGKIESSKECLLLLKSKKTLASKLEKFILSKHPYKCVCLLEIDISKSHLTYEKWLLENL